VTKLHQFPKFAMIMGVVLASWSMPNQSRALVSTGSGVIKLEVTTSGTYDSYMIGTPDYGSDFSGAIHPQLRYNHLIGPTEFEVYGGVTYNRYQHYKMFDSEDYSGGISSNFPVSEGSRLSGNVSATYVEATEVDQSLNDRVPTKTGVLALNTTYLAGLKTTLSDTVSYSQVQRQIYGTQIIWDNEFKYSYTNFLENTKLDLTHRFTRTKSDASNYASWSYDPSHANTVPNSALDQYANSIWATLSHPVYGQIIGEVNYGFTWLTRSASETASGETNTRTSLVSFTLRGPFLPPSRYPKVESSASISYEQNVSPGINDTGEKTITGNIDLAWNARERTRVSLGALRSQSLASNNFTVVSTGVHAGFTENIGLATVLNGKLSYDWYDYRGITRNDEIFTANVGLHHPLTQRWSVGADYTFESTKSNAPQDSFQAAAHAPQDYVRQVIVLSIGCVY
jgi:hypothetical protein